MQRDLLLLAGAAARAPRERILLVLSDLEREGGKERGREGAREGGREKGKEKEEKRVGARSPFPHPLLPFPPHKHAHVHTH